MNIPPDFPLLFADAALMEQALAHLLLNAAIHTPPGTPIAVEAGGGGEAGQVFIAVADEGPGVPAELRGRIFGKFARGASAPTGGLGLGLSIVRGFLQAQGGDAHVETPAQGGARFVLFLPRAVCEEVPGE